ncbi:MULTISPECIES: hypothetical protein [unclassified Imperialibacter]|uniref:hypothetical protein n=1 Tax=unclassified Imperialibacter TaxID=2629706 RepID=UPI0012556327|nr:MULTISPECIES: hypothetical protein [unclassified Imperialibacter]CAD5253813.1 hypothetical protein IMPERIA89_190032 [Imperialibacter sp. 89]CAD5275307.1 hypothetical protein IMPERIA75_410035 [Imperialibacter sp. 75]VVT19649.1 hypothetical protein IMPR6_290035 [Imperialibacter sp. EC-SDR9]
MSTINVYLKRNDLIDRRPPVSLNITPSVDLIPRYGLKEYNLGNMSVLSFEDHILEGRHMVFTNMIIPAFFDQSPMAANGSKTEVHGLFLINLDNSGDKAKAFVEDKEIGPFGCPKRLLTQEDDKAYFTFNNQRFYPFIMTDFTVGYYVCDGKAATGSQPPLAWPDYSEYEIGIALDSPLTYDATLGLFITRQARVII